MGDTTLFLWRSSHHHRFPDVLNIQLHFLQQTSPTLRTLYHCLDSRPCMYSMIGCFRHTQPTFHFWSTFFDLFLWITDPLKYICLWDWAFLPDIHYQALCLFWLQCGSRLSLSLLYLSPSLSWLSHLPSSCHHWSWHLTSRSSTAWF